MLHFFYICYICIYSLSSLSVFLVFTPISPVARLFVSPEYILTLSTYIGSANTLISHCDLKELTYTGPIPILCACVCVCAGLDRVGCKHRLEATSRLNENYKHDKHSPHK